MGKGKPALGSHRALAPAGPVGTQMQPRSSLKRFVCPLDQVVAGKVTSGLSGCKAARKREGKGWGHLRQRVMGCSEHDLGGLYVKAAALPQINLNCACRPELSKDFCLILPLKC